MKGLWLIDGSYIYKAAKSFQKHNPAYEKKGVDYKKLKQRILEEFGLDSLDGWYFNSTPDPASDAQNAFHAWLKTAEPKGPGIRVKLYDLKQKHTHCPKCDESITFLVQKGVDVGIATTALRYFTRYDAIILSAGDGDFKDFVSYIVEVEDRKLFITGFGGSISPDLQQFSSAVYLLDEHYNEVCDTRDVEPFAGADDVADD